MVPRGPGRSQLILIECHGDQAVRRRRDHDCQAGSGGLVSACRQRGGQAPAAAIERGDAMAASILGSALATARGGGFCNTVVTAAPEVTRWGGWGSNPRPADYENYGTMHHKHYLHGYHEVVPLVALIALAARVTRSTNRSTVAALVPLILLLCVTSPRASGLRSRPAAMRLGRARHRRRPDRSPGRGLRPLASGALLTSDGRASLPRSCGRRRRRRPCG
jgi:hypothetical protein